MNLNMCGIYLSISRDKSESPGTVISQALQNRGPDSFKVLRFQFAPHGPSSSEETNQAVFMTFASSILSLRGDHIIMQPVLGKSSECVLCWNGEVWQIGGSFVTGNDSEALFALLQEAAACNGSQDDNSQSKHGACSLNCFSSSLMRILQVINSVSGPYAFSFLDGRHQRMLFARDPLGRRSLLHRNTTSGDLIIASVSDGVTSNHWKEVEADGIYVVDFSMTSSSLSLTYPTLGHHGLQDVSFDIIKVPWLNANAASNTPLSPISLILPFPPLNKSLPSFPVPQFRLNCQSPSVKALEEVLRKSLIRRIRDIPRPPATGHEFANRARPRLAILFSGGVDCSLLARLAHDLLPVDHVIDLLNVAFENPRALKAAKGRPGSHMSSHVKGQPVKSNARHDLVDGSDLAWHKTEYPEEKTQGTTPYDICPDRITGRKSFCELQRLCPERTWQFVEGGFIFHIPVPPSNLTQLTQHLFQINIPYSEALAHRNQVISLMHPHNTEMDLSISYAFYFAARGSGYIYNPGNGEIERYSTPARVLLSGLGADELFAGYTRHATAFIRNGFAGLLDELELDVCRLGTRNLGRDDRVIACWAKEIRYPYLDEGLLRWALAAPIWEKCGFGQIREKDEDWIEPGKQVLRLLARDLGMVGISQEKKRAVQFGARTAKMDNGRTKGSEILSPSD